MNIFKKIYARIYQTVLKLALPFLPYKQPQILKSDNDIVETLRLHKIKSVLMVTYESLRNLSLTKSLEDTLNKTDINLVIYDKTVPNPTTQNVNDALALYKQNNCNAIIAFGGGSAIDCAKGVGALVARPNKTLGQMKGVMKVRKKLPLLIAIPTTAGTGSETTLAAVITDSKTRHKYAINDFPLIPKYAVLNASLTVGLPKSITSTTGMDALTHAIEAYIGRSTTKETRECALFAVKTIFDNILEVYNNPQNLKARENMLLASYKAGVAFTKSYVGYVHAIAHSLGGKYNIAHGLANAIILPYVLKKYGNKVHKKLWEMGVYAGLFNKNTNKHIGSKIFIEKILELNNKMGIGQKIPQIEENDINDLAEIAEKEANPLYPVPVIFSINDLKEIYYELKN